MPMVLCLAAILGIVFFFADMYNQKVHVNPSFIAGTSVSYFFLVVLPEIAGEMQMAIFGLPSLEYVFILVGISYAHFLEKYILQHVEARSREKAESLIKKKEMIDAVEDRVSIAMAESVQKKKVDETQLESMADILKTLIKTESDVEAELKALKKVLHDHVNARLEEFHDMTEFIYHCIIGIILAGLLFVNLAEALLFYINAILMAIISHTQSRQRIFINLDIEMDYVETRKKKAELALAAPIGIIIGVILDLTFLDITEFIYMLFSFISGALLYIIMREVIPEKEKGKSSFFAAGLLGFSAIVILLNAFGLAF
ncbi:MAG: hypothetical protein Q6373_000730 [Candidatus Sigynarchaeota archaeon]